MALKSQLWSCSSLQEALDVLKLTETMPDDPEQLRTLIEDFIIEHIIYRTNN